MESVFKYKEQLKVLSFSKKQLCSCNWLKPFLSSTVYLIKHCSGQKKILTMGTIKIQKILEVPSKLKKTKVWNFSGYQDQLFSSLTYSIMTNY